MAAARVHDFRSGPPRRLARRAGLVFLTAALLPSSARAQSVFKLTGSLAANEVYDDNIFYLPTNAEKDFISRLSARLGAGYRSATLGVDAHGRLDAEAFRRHRELDTPAAYREAGVSLTWAPSSRVAAAAGASYAQAQASGQLNVITGLEAGRVPAQQLFTTASLSRRLGALTKATVEGNFTREQAGDGPFGDTQAASLMFDRRLGPGDQGRLRYAARRFVYGQQTTLSHAVTLGWSRNVTPAVRFDFEAGPRLTVRTVGAEVAAGFRHSSRRGEVALSYLRTETTVVGRSGPVTAEGVTATFSRQLLRSLRIAGGPAAFKVRGAGSQTSIQRMNLEVGWRMTRQLSLAASHAFTLQRGGLGLAPGLDRELAHNSFSLRVAAGSAGN